MKKLTLILLLILLSFVACGCSSSEDINQQQPNSETSNNTSSEVETVSEKLLFEKVDPVTKENKSINITVNPNLELVSIIQYLGNYNEKTGLMTPHSFQYKNDVDKYFKEFKDHEAVKFFNYLTSVNFTYAEPPKLMLYLDSELQLKNNVQLPDYIVDEMNGEENSNKCLSLLKEFYVDTQFQNFFNDHIDYYNKIIDVSISTMGENNYIGQVESYYGMSQNSYNIILVSLFNAGGFGPKIKVDENKYDLYSVVGTVMVQNGIPWFGSETGFRYMVVHEFSHSFVDYLSEKYETEVSNYENLLKPIKDVMKDSGYGIWRIVVNEHIVRATNCRLTLGNDEQLAANKGYYCDKAGGFIYLDNLIEKLKEYDNNRDKYKTFEEFYPELLTAFYYYFNNQENINTALEFVGSTYEVPFKGNLLIVVPTNEKTENESIRKIAEIIKTNASNQFGNNAKIITDEEALKTDLSKSNVIICGTIEGNKLLSKYKYQLPFEMNDTSVTINENEYKGDKIQLITAIKNPENKQNGFLIYTANTEENMLNITDNGHASYGYYVFIDNNTDPIRGYYEMVD